MVGDVCVCVMRYEFMFTRITIKVYISGISLTATCKSQDVAKAKFYIYRSRFNPAI